MIDISRPIGETTAQTYYKEKWTLDDYYTQANQLQGFWYGQGAERLGLRGAVGEKEFAWIMDGRRPDAAYEATQLQNHWERVGAAYQLRDINSKVAAEVFAENKGWKHSGDPGKVYPTLERAQQAARNYLLGKAILYHDERHSRRAWDIVCRPGKSVSVTAVVGGDHRIIELHRKANARLLDVMERLIQARGGNNHPAHTTGNFIVARFEHYTSRPEEVLTLTGERVLVPNALLHTHNVMANMTLDEKDKLRSIDPYEMFRFQRIGKQVYQTYMAHGLRELGYQVEFGKNGAPEIQGYTQEYLASESLRSQAIQRHLTENGLDGARAADLIARQNRNDKLEISPEETMMLLSANAAAHGNQHQPIIDAARERSKDLHIEPHMTAHEAVTLAKRSLAENYAVFEHWDLVTKALEFGQGHILLPEIECNIAARTQTLEQHKQGIPAEFMLALHERPGKPGIRYTTDTQYNLEREACELMAAGRNQVAPLAPHVTVEEIQAEFRRLTNGKAPNVEQIEGVRVALASPDRATALVGVAGAGKTTELETIQSFAQGCGFAVIGVASTSRAVEEMRQANIHAVTLSSFLLVNSPEARERAERAIQSYRGRIEQWGDRIERKKEDLRQAELRLLQVLASPQSSSGRKTARLERLQTRREELKQTLSRYKYYRDEQFQKLESYQDRQKARGMSLDEKPRYILADESSLAATYQYCRLLRCVAARPEDRMLLVGDPGQHESIEAARVFDLLLQAGIRRAELSQIVRQENPEIKAVVEKCQVKEHAAALDLLETQGRVKVLKRAERLVTVVQRYLESPSDSIIINPDNQGRKELNALVREQQKAQGVIEQSGIKGIVLVPRQDLTRADREAAFKYEVGNLIRFREGSRSLHIERGSYWKVAGRDTAKNIVSIYREKPDGTLEQRTFNPQYLKHLEVYEREERELCVGDKILFKRQVKEHGLANGTAAVIEKIDGRQVTARVEPSGRQVTWTVPEQQISSIPHWDYGHASTSYSFQGATVGRTFVHLDTANKTAQRLITQALFYVAASRPKYELEVYTNDVARLRSLLSTSREKGMALSPEERYQYVPEEQKQASRHAISRFLAQNQKQVLPFAPKQEAAAAPLQPSWRKEERAWREHLQEKYLAALERGASLFTPAEPYRSQQSASGVLAPALPTYTERQKQLIEMHEVAAQIYAQNLRTDAQTQEYLTRRKVAPEWIAEFRLGVSRTDSTQLVQALRKYGPELMRESGLFVETESGELRDRFQGRLMFPIQDTAGNVIAFAGRKLEEEAWGPKYLNSPKTELYDKSATLYNLHRVGEAAHVVTVEGYFDAIAAQAAGVWAVASCGTAFTEAHAQRLTGRDITINTDADQAGQKAAQRQVELLLAQGTVPAVAVLTRKDASEVLEKEGAAAYREQIGQAAPLVEWLSSRVQQRHPGADAYARADSIRELINLLAKAAPAQRAEVDRQLSHQLGVNTQQNERTASLVQDQEERRDLARQRGPSQAMEVGA